LINQNIVPTFVRIAFTLISLIKKLLVIITIVFFNYWFFYVSKYLVVPLIVTELIVSRHMIKNLVHIAQLRHMIKNLITVYIIMQVFLDTSKKKKLNVIAFNNETIINQ